MFANTLIAQKIEQPDPKEAKYIITAVNTFVLPVEGSFFSFDCITNIGDFDQRKETDKFKFSFFKQDKPDHDLIDSSETTFKNLDKTAKNVSLVGHFNNVPIPSFGVYVLSVLLNEEEISKAYISFRKE